MVDENEEVDKEDESVGSLKKQCSTKAGGCFRESGALGASKAATVGHDWSRKWLEKA